MKEIVADLQAEREALDRFPVTLTDEMWDLPTPAEGWTVKDSVAHIARIDDAAVKFINGDISPLDMTGGAGEGFDGTGLRQRGPNHRRRRPSIEQAGTQEGLLTTGQTSGCLSSHAYSWAIPFSFVVEP